MIVAALFAVPLKTDAMKIWDLVNIDWKHSDQTALFYYYFIIIYLWFNYMVLLLYHYFSIISVLLFYYFTIILYYYLWLFFIIIYDHHFTIISFILLSISLHVTYHYIQPAHSRLSCPRNHWSHHTARTWGCRSHRGRNGSAMSDMGPPRQGAPLLGNK